MNSQLSFLSLLINGAQFKFFILPYTHFLLGEKKNKNNFKSIFVFVGMKSYKFLLERQTISYTKMNWHRQNRRGMNVTLF